MKITNIYTKNLRNNFGENKIYIYSDFDRTLSPNTTGDVFYATDKNKIEKAKNNFELINKILEKYKDITLFITTGRTNDELRLMYDLYKKQGIVFPNAKSIYIKEGADEILKDKNITNDYPYTISNTSRNEKIKNKTHWNKKDLTQKVFNIIKENNLTPLECNSTLSAEKYGKYSIFSTPEKIKNDTVLFRNVGEMKLFLGFVNEIPQKKYDKIKQEISEYLEKQGIQYKLKEKTQDHECNKFRTMMFMPVIENHILSKRYDVKEKLNTIDNTDLVIVAGDGINDVEMLNPVSYTDKNSEEEIKKLPYLGIIVQKENEPEPELEKLNSKFGPNSQFKKLKTIKEGTFAEEIEKIAKEKYGD